MWDALPPVVPSSATPVDELAGVHVATHAYGMLSGNPSTAAPPMSYPLSTPTHRSRSSGGGNVHSTPTRSPSTASISMLSAVAAAGPPNSNPFATPRDSSLTSLGAGGAHRDLSGRSNVDGGSSSSQLLPMVMTTASSTPPQLPPGVEGGDGRQGSNVGVPATVAAAAAVGVVGGGGAALPTPQHSRTLSSTSTTYANARYATGSQQLQPVPTAAPAAAAPAAGTSSFSRSVASARYAPPMSSPPPPQLASAFSPTVQSRDPSAVFITRSISPRHPHGPLDSVAGASRIATGRATTTPASASTTSAAAPWESPGSISIGSARLNNDPTSLYLSPGMPDSARESVSRGDGRATSAASLDRHVSSSTARVAAYNAPDHRSQRSVSSRGGGGGNGGSGGGGGALPAASSAAAAVQLDLAPLQVEAASASTLVPSAAAAGAAPFTRLPQAIETPTMAQQDGLSSSSPYAGGMSTSSPLSGGFSATRVPLHPAAVVPLVRGGEASNNNNSSNSMAMASGTSLTFVSPHFQAASTALDDASMTSTMSAAAAPPPAGLTTVARLSGAVSLAEATAGPLPLPNAHLLFPAASTAATTTTTGPATTGNTHPMESASGSQHSGSVPGRAPLERAGSDVVLMVRTDTPPSGNVHARERSADVRHRYALPPGLKQQHQQVSGSPPSSVLTPYHSAAAGPAPVFWPYTPPAMPAAAAAAAAGAAAPFTPPQPAMEGGRHHVSIAQGTVSPRRAQEAHAQDQHPQHQGLHLFAVQSSHHDEVRSSSAADTADGPHMSPGVAGTIDHNQSFYLGTTGNDNLRRSFFFPPSARLPHGEWEDGVNGSVGRCGSVEGQTAEDTASHNFDLASYLRHAAAIDRQNTSLPPVAVPAAAAAADVGGGAASLSHAPPPLLQQLHQQPQQQQYPSTSTVSTEATEGEHYCSPVLYCVSSFSTASPSQPGLTRLPLQPPPPPLPSVPFTAAAPVGMVETVLPPGGCVQRGPSPLPPAPLWPQSPSTQPSVYASPLTQSQRSSLPEEPLGVNVMAGGRPRLTVAFNSVGGGGASTASASSPYTHTGSIGGGGGGVPQRGASTRRTYAGERVRNATIATTNASFLSPTLANSLLRHRFEDSMASASEASFALPESSAHSTSRAAAAGQAAGPVTPPSPAATTQPTAPSSLPQTPQKATTMTVAPPPPPAGPAPPYVLEWERSLIAFQNRAESYYTFKNLCTETYLTLIEHDVDRFLVCYYSGGAVRPEEAVQEALASRAGTPAAVNANILSSTGGSSGSAPRNNNNGGGGLQKMIQTNKTLQKLSEAGSKWFTTLKRTALTPAPPRADVRTPLSSLGTATPVRVGGGGGGRSGASSVNSGSVDHLASTRPLLQLPALDHPPPCSTEQGEEEWWMTAHDGCNNDHNNVSGGEPTYSIAMDPSMTRSAPRPLPLSPQGMTTVTDTTSTDVPQLLDRPLSSSGRSFTTYSTTGADAFSTGSSSVVGAPLAVGTPKKAPALSQLSYNIAAEEELQCLRQLGAYMANVIPESYMDARPSEQVLQHVRCNYPIILNALQHVLLLSGVDSTMLESSARSSSSTSSSRHAAEAAKALIASRLRQGLLLPSIQATWRDYLSPLEMKVKELVHIAEENIDPILAELEDTPTADTAAAAGEKGGSVSALADLQARQRLRALRDQPVRRLSRLLRGDEEYLGAIHVMDDEFIENGEAWQTRSATMRRAGAALSDYVPVYGLVLSRLHRLEIEHRTVLELWCGGV